MLSGIVCLRRGLRHSDTGTVSTDHVFAWYYFLPSETGRLPLTELVVVKGTPTFPGAVVRGTDDDAHYPVPGKVGVGVSGGGGRTEGLLCCCPRNRSSLRRLFVLVFTAAGRHCGIFRFECEHVENDFVPTILKNRGDFCGLKSWGCKVIAARVSLDGLSPMQVDEKAMFLFSRISSFPV